MTVPASPKLYHITHLENIPRILQYGGLCSDARKEREKLSNDNVGMTHIKQRRLIKPVSCYPGTHVGDYVPFYLCPRSVMLYILHKGNHPDIDYKGGQVPIVHLQIDMMQAIQLANQSNQPWAFSDRNASEAVASFFNDTTNLGQVNWGAIQSLDFTNSVTKSGKQAEFLIFDKVPWQLIEKIGVINDTVQGQVIDIIEGHGCKPIISIERSWYY